MEEENKCPDTSNEAPTFNCDTILESALTENDAFCKYILEKTDAATAEVQKNYISLGKTKKQEVIDQLISKYGSGQFTQDEVMSLIVFERIHALLNSEKENLKNLINEAYKKNAGFTEEIAILFAKFLTVESFIRQLEDESNDEEDDCDGCDECEEDDCDNCTKGMSTDALKDLECDSKFEEFLQRMKDNPDTEPNEK